MQNAILLTAGYTSGDLTPIAQANMNAAVAQGRPLEIPAGDHILRARLNANLAQGPRGLVIYGAGHLASRLIWTADAVDEGFNFVCDNDQKPILLDDFGLLTQKRNVGTAVNISFRGQVIPVGGEPNIWDRVQPRGHAHGLLVRGADGFTGWNKGIYVDCPIAFHVRDCTLYGVPVGDGTQWVSDRGIYLGAENGYGHPVECYIQENRVFHWNTGIQCEGMEGVFVQENQVVGVGIGIHYKDNLGRPHFNCCNNHINCSVVGVLVDNSSEFKIDGNLIYKVQGGPDFTTGVNIRGIWSVFGQIVDNCFENSDTATTRGLTSIIIESGRQISIDGNCYRKNTPGAISGVWLTAGARRVVVGDTERFEQSDGPYGGVNFEVLDQGTNNVRRNA